jgi:hypothetical protein
MINPFDPFTGPPRRDPADPSRQEITDPGYTDWKAYVIGGIAAVVVLIGLVWVSSSDPNQQSAENQPRVERPADRPHSPPPTPTPPPTP